MQMSERTHSVRRQIAGLILATLSVGLPASVGQEAVSPAHLALFNDEALPVLQDNCMRCHGGEDKIKGGLNLTTREGLFAGGDGGEVIDLENPAESFLLEMISYKDADHEMPPKGKMSPKNIEILTRWVEAGAPFDPAFVFVPSEEHHGGGFETEINEKTRNYWAFRPVGTPEPPIVADSEWAKHPIDAYIYAKLDEARLKPNPSAEKAELIRRAYYDLTGLPPTPAEVEAFVADESPDAYEGLIDRLLALPQYGEKWGRHWLDVARYAETNGYERDNPKENVWRYRDYVIRAFNEDKPYTQFIREQIAGDELDEVTADSIIATGFQRLGIWDDEPADPEQAFFDGMDDVVSVTSEAFLGMTMGCARCHDHKIDPIPQEDYYRFLAFFGNTLNNIEQRRFKKTAYTLNTQRVIATPEEVAAYEKVKREHDAEIESLEVSIAKIEERIESHFSNPEREDAADAKTRETLLRKWRTTALGAEELTGYMALKDRLRALERNKVPSLATALSIRENGRETVPVHVLLRGSAHSPAKEVQPGLPQVLGLPDPEIPTPAPDAQSSGRRRVLADWIASDDNPLTARVMVNRAWHYHFGRGIARSPSNFGQNGDQPTHPELLDWLARDFMDNGWSLKQLHKRIMLSRTYQMSARGREDALAKDPNNDLFWRVDMRRLSAEEVRDSLLALTGKLNLKMGGPSIYSKVPDEVLATASRPDHAWGHSPEEEQNRRSVYIHVKRSLPEPMLKSFDSADTDASCAVRFTTTVPTQALTMLNGEFINEQAEMFADRLRREVGPDREQQVERALALVTSRDPERSEIDAGLAMIDDMEKGLGLDPETALDRFCLLAVNLNEFIYLD